MSQFNPIFVYLSTFENAPMRLNHRLLCVLYQVDTFDFRYTKILPSGAI